MSRHPTPLIRQFSGPLFVVLMCGAWFATRAMQSPPRESLPHAGDTQAGVLVSFGQDRYHAEALIERTGTLRLFILGRDPSQLLHVPLQTVAAFAALEGEPAVALTLQAQPHASDPVGTTSQFVAELPDGLRQGPLRVSIPCLIIGRERFRLGFGSRSAMHAPEFVQHPASDGDEALYLVAEGKYTDRDIAANGDVPSRRFRGFRAQHDFNPQPGDRLCPITRTKANPKCTWIIDGQRYQFCCPPCIDEFIALAKRDPDAIRPADSYRLEDATMPNHRQAMEPNNHGDN